MVKAQVVEKSRPLSEAQKAAIMNEEYMRPAHRIGFWTSMLHTLIFFLPPLYVTFVHGITPNWDAVARGTLATLAVSGPFWIIEPISYFVVLGVAGTYISFLAGNVSNFRLPVSALAQEVAGVKPGSHEGEVISAIGLLATQVMLTLAALAGAVSVTIIVGFLPKTVLASFDWLLPSIFAAIFVQFCLKAWRYALIALVAGVFVVSYSGLPTWSQVPILALFMAALALTLYSRKLWIPKEFGE